ncbi:hypothetical protein BJX61DRAFT_512495 [Aspergillus egyptiacus]|nr:hypothetical protein BJX61DRAFT_512495 [Aspergillus egyptiacus]
MLSMPSNSQRNPIDVFICRPSPLVNIDTGHTVPAKKKHSLTIWFRSSSHGCHIVHFNSNKSVFRNRRRGQGALDRRGALEDPTHCRKAVGLTLLSWLSTHGRSEIGGRRRDFARARHLDGASGKLSLSRDIPEHDIVHHLPGARYQPGMKTFGCEEKWRC